MKRCSSATARLAVAAILSCAASATPVAKAAEVRLTGDYGAVIVEAEAPARADERWVPTGPFSPQREHDPDGNHTDGASGRAYLELLPDRRVRDEDVLDPANAVWAVPGFGPTAFYRVSFPEPGRYDVHVRAYASGPHDGGLHVGIDGEWPASGAALQVCEAGANAWRWSSGQRGSGGRRCGVEGTVWLTVDAAGEHTVGIAGLDDGFELDRIMLIRDRSDGRRRCAPVFDRANEIGCTERRLETDAAVDPLDSTRRTRLVARLDGLPGIGEFGAPVTLAFSVTNAGDVPALGAALSLELPRGLDVASTSAGCVPAERRVLCTIGTLGAGRTGRFSVAAVAVEPGGYAVGTVGTARNADTSNAVSSLGVTSPPSNP